MNSGKNCCGTGRVEIVGSIRGPRGSKKVQAQGELEGEVNNQQMEKLDPRCIKASASHSGQRVCKCLVGAACRLVRAAGLELLVAWPEPLHSDPEQL